MDKVERERKRMRGWAKAEAKNLKKFGGIYGEIGL